MGAINSGSLVFHKKYGQCSVRHVFDDTAIIRTPDGTLQECSADELVLLKTIWDGNDGFSSLKTLLRVQGNIIEAINNTWGIFSQTAISLLPHQLWVCNQTMKKWPTRMMIADDVGLGKTIEAGLILTSAITSGKAKRVLILTPAKLTEQWQKRMKEMFGLNFAIYASAVDKQTETEFNRDLLIGSLATVRMDSGEKHKHLLEADPWDIVMIDEAHHAGVSEQGQTLGFKLIDMMKAAGKIRSLLLFTATPHQGKNEQFWKLMELIDEDIFSDDTPLKKRYDNLRNYMIRNAKSMVTDMHGDKLFKDIKQHPYTYEYTAKEAAFYERMTDYIREGKTYAENLGEEKERRVTLVLIALQKIASSSVAAIRNAFRKRLEMLDSQAKAYIKENPDLEDDEDVVGKASFLLMKDERQNIRELLDLAEDITDESRIERIIEIIDENYRDESILLFTEYKATQALMIKALRKNYGADSVCFINGDNALTIDGRKELSPRKEAMQDFNAGRKRFLVSTEASGEGVDLQDNCHVLIHVDLPWNPMRLHQRVGRIYRFGQKKDVDVVSLRNMHTIEGNLWRKLDTKLDNINIALGHVMDNPEDMKQLVIGVESTSFYTDLFAEAQLRVESESLDEWFDSKTQRMGNKEAIDTIRGIETNAARFDLSCLDDVPKFELSDLKPFLEGMFRSLGKQYVYEADGNVMLFKLPEEWKANKDPNYVDPSEFVAKRFVFSRRKEDMGQIPSLGNVFFDKALDTARSYEDNFALIDGDKSYLIIKVFERDTTKDALSNFTFVGYSLDREGNTETISLRDLFKITEELLRKKYPKEDMFKSRNDAISPDLAKELSQKALKEYEALGINYDYPQAEIFAFLKAR